MKKWSKVLIVIILLILAASCEKDTSHEDTSSEDDGEKVEVIVGVLRTGSILNNLGKMDVLVDGEEVFKVSGSSDNAVRLKMSKGEHTIQTKAQGNKSKKIKFNVSKDGEIFYYEAEISNWYGIKMKEKEYIPERP